MFKKMMQSLLWSVLLLACSSSNAMKMKSIVKQFLKNKDSIKNIVVNNSINDYNKFDLSKEYTTCSASDNSGFASKMQQIELTNESKQISNNVTQLSEVSTKA